MMKQNQVSPATSRQGSPLSGAENKMPLSVEQRGALRKSKKLFPDLTGESRLLESGEDFLVIEVASDFE